ncbi:MAG: efflux RND transporter periplasmic adaptor subunit [Planctomycetota bacterium]
MSNLLERPESTDVTDAGGVAENYRGEAHTEAMDGAEISRPMQPRSNRPWKRLLGTLLGSLMLIASVVAILFGIGLVKAKQIQYALAAPPPPEIPIAVRLVTAIESEYQASTNVVGTVLAPQMVRLRNEEPGTVTEVLMQPGGMVKQGDLLLRMDIRLEQANLAAAIATLDQSMAKLRRSEKLNRNNAISDDEVDQAVASAARARAEVQRIEVIMDRKTIKAPFDARVGLFQLHRGQYLDIGSDIVTLEGNDDHLLVDFAVPGHVARWLKIQDDVAMSIENGTALGTARIVAIDARADSQSRLTKMRARLEPPPPSLRPGDSVLVTAGYGDAKPVVKVPQTAIRRGPSGDTVFVAVSQTPAESQKPAESQTPVENDPSAADPPADGTLRASLRVVQVGGSGKETSWILSGVRAGEQVVADGSFKVVDGALLMPQTP